MIEKREWCNIECLNLDKHHYPIRKSNGGNEVIEICKNCHQSFHAMTD